MRDQVLCLEFNLLLFCAALKEKHLMLQAGYFKAELVSEFADSGGSLTFA